MNRQQKKDEIRKWITRLKDLPTTVVVELLAEVLTTAHDSLEKNGGRFMDEKEFLAWQKSEAGIVDKPKVERKGFGLFKPKPVLVVATPIDDRIEKARLVLEELERQKVSGSPAGFVQELEEVKELIETAYKRLIALQKKVKP